MATNTGAPVKGGAPTPTKTPAPAGGSSGGSAIPIPTTGYGVSKGVTVPAGTVTPPPPVPSTPSDYAAALKGASRDAFVALNDLFSSYGLGSLAPKIFDYIKSGYSADTISILLQDTAEYKQRFAGNAERVKNGLPVLSPAQYLATEQAYRQIFQQSGLPKSFYDSPQDFQNFIGQDISPTEVNSRVDLAKQATALASPAYKQALNQMGIDDGHLAAYFLDESKALPLVQKAAATAAIGAEALQRGFQFNQQDAQHLAEMGITGSQAASGYAQIGSQFGQLQSLASIYGGAWTQQMAEQATFVGGTAATQERERLMAQERGSFAGSAGGARGAFGNVGGAH